MSELLPCPFCGSDAMTRLADTVPRRGMLHSWYVVCLKSSCRCHLGFYGEDEDGDCGIYETEEEAIAAWNTRAFDEDTYFSGVNAGLDAAEALERTCRLVQREDIPTEGKPCHYIECTCGHGFWWPIYEVLRCCPKCGAKVIEDA